MRLFTTRSYPFLPVLFVFFFLASGITGHAQAPARKPVRVLFLGNSYTYVNDLPKMCTEVAASAGDSLIVDSHTVGGYTWKQHLADTASLRRLQAGGWNWVVLQEQSQLPSYPEAEVQQRVYPFARSLDSMAHVYSPAAKTVFYMTWGRKEGDSARCAVWPAVCTYGGMDSLLALRYKAIAHAQHAELSPVGSVWRWIRTQRPSLELYQADKSHPSVAGTYAAACCFYTLLSGKDPAAIRFNPGLDAGDAAFIRSAVRTVVFQHLKDWVSP